MIRGREMLGSGWPPSILADETVLKAQDPRHVWDCHVILKVFISPLNSFLSFTFEESPTYTNYIHGFEVRKLLMSPRQKNPVVALHMTVPKNRVTICPSRPFFSYFVRLSASNSILHRHWANQHPTSSRTLPHLHICRGPPPRPCQQQP